VERVDPRVEDELRIGRRPRKDVSVAFSAASPIVSVFRISETKFELWSVKFASFAFSMSPRANSISIPDAPIPSRDLRGPAVGRGIERAREVADRGV